MLIKYTTRTSEQHFTPAEQIAYKVKREVTFHLHRGNEFDEIRISTVDPFEPGVEAYLRGRKVAWWGGSAAEYIFLRITIAFPEILAS